MSAASPPPPHFPDRFNMADYFLDARVREGEGARWAVTIGGRRYSFDEVHERAHRAAGALRSEFVDFEDRVLLILPDGIEFVDAFFGTLMAGGVFCLANPLVKQEDFAYLLGYTRARAVVAHASTLDRLAPALAAHPRCRARFVVGGEAEGFHEWERALAQASPDTATAETSKDDLAGWLFTSGTTGKPKGAVHFHHDFPFNTECYAKQVLGLRADDVFVSVSRLFFGYGTGTNLMFPFALGAEAILFPEKPSADRLFDHIEAHRVTVLTNVPAMIRQMLDSPRAESADLSSLRLCLSAGEALPPDLYARWMERWPNAELLDGIGSAEMFHIYISNRPGRAVPGSLGEIVPGYEARIVGADDQDLAHGEVGRLWVKGDSAALCYHCDHEKSKETLRGDWVVTADLFRRDADGVYWYSGRADDLLKVGGIFVSPLEIEDCLSRHPAVRECAVVGVDDGGGLTIPKAFVALREGFLGDDALVDELQLWAKEKLARYKFPRMVSFVEALPRNDRGKILRRELT